MQKLCPIPLHEEEGFSTREECEGEKCGWWDSVDYQCSIKSMAEALKAISRYKDKL